MQQVIVGGRNDALSKTATEYSLLCGGEFSWSTAGTQRRQIAASSGTFSNFLVELSAAPGGGGSYTITLLNVTQGTSLAVTITDPATQGLNAGSIAVFAGDVIQLRSTYSAPSATPTARWSCLFESTNPNESLIMGACQSQTASIQYCPIMGGFSSTATENYTYQIIPTAGKIKNLYVALENDPGTSPDAFRYTLRVNGANSDDGAGNPLQVTIVADNKTGNDTTHEIIVAAGDYVDLMIEPLNTPSTGSIGAVGFTFVADTDGESLLLGGSYDPPSNSQAEYIDLVTPVWWDSWSTSESSWYQGGQPTTLKNLYVKLSAAPGVDKHTIIGVRVNGSTELSVDITGADTTGNDLVNTVGLSNYDDLSMISTPSGTPATAMVYWGLVGYIASAGWANIDKVSGVDAADIAKVKEVAVTDVAKIMGVAV